MRFLLLLLFVSTVLTEDQIVKKANKSIEDKKELKKSTEGPKSKTEKRDSSDQTGSFGIHVNPNDEPFKPMINSQTPFVAATSDTQQVYYDKSQLTIDEGAGSAKGDTNPPNANAYQAQYTQVVNQQQYQKQQQQQQNTNHLRVAAKNGQQQQQNKPSILYAVPQSPAYHYERIPQQHQQHQQYQQQHQILNPAGSVLPVQRGQQKQIQYVIAIPLSNLRQLQQQLIHQQQQEEVTTHSQVYKGEQQPAAPVYSIAGPLARDHQGSYRPFHRFAATAVNDISSLPQHQTGSSPTLPQQITPASPAPPGYVTQYVQIPASILLAAMQSAQVKQQLQQLQQRPVHSPHHFYQQQPQLHLQLQQPIQQHVQSQSPQLYYYQPQQQQQQSQSKQSQTSPPVYAYHLNQLQQQQPSESHERFQHLTEQQQVSVGKQSQPVRGVRPAGNLTPTQQYDSTAESHENEEKAQLVTLQAPTRTNLNAHTYTNAHGQQYRVQAPQSHQQQAATARQIVHAQAPTSYEHFVYYNPQYVRQYQEQQQQRQPHRLQIKSHQHIPFVEHLNNLHFSQGIHDPTSLPFLRLQPTPGEVPLFNLNMVTPQAIPQPFIPGAYQQPFTPLGMPSKVTSFTNVLLQPFSGHPPSYQTPEIGTAVAGSAESTPYLHSTGGIRYGTHLYHPPSSAATVLAGNEQHNPQAQPDPRVLTTAAQAKVSASSAKAPTSAVAGSPTIVKYP